MLVYILGDLMYINYLTLKNLANDILKIYKDKDFKTLIDYIEKSCYFTNFMDLLDIEFLNNKYNLYLSGEYFGTIKSDLKYDCNNITTKNNLFKYFLFTNQDKILEFINHLINYNIYMMQNNNDELRMKLALKNKKNVGTLNIKINYINCMMDYDVFADNTFVGKFIIYGNYYYLKKHKSNVNMITVKNKEYVLKSMNRYNKNYK